MNSIMGTFDTRIAINNMNMQASKLSETYTKLSTGKNTSLPYQNPTDNIKVTKLSSDAKSYTTLMSDLNDKYTMLMVASNGIEDQQSRIIKIKDLASQTQRADVSSIEKSKITKEVQLLVQDFDKTANQTKYHNVQLLSGNLENAKINTNIDGYQSINLSIPSSDTSKIVQARFETGDTIRDANKISMEFGLKDNKTFKLPSVIISHSSNTGIGQLAQMINDNQDTLGLRASFDVSIIGEKSMLFGVVKNLRINDIEIGTVTMNIAKDYEKIIAAINKKTDETGVKASLHDEKLLLESDKGRGIVIGAQSGIKVLNLGENNTESYGKLTLANDDGFASNVINGQDVGFLKTKSEKISFDKLATGNLNVSDKLAIGIKGKDIESNKKLDFNNDVFRDHFLSTLDKISNLLENTKKHISEVQEKIINRKNIANDNKITTDINISNIDDIDYAAEILNSTKYQNLKEGASHIFARSLSFNNKIYDILFDSLKD